MRWLLGRLPVVLLGLAVGCTSNSIKLDTGASGPDDDDDGATSTGADDGVDDADTGVMTTVGPMTTAMTTTTTTSPGSTTSPPLDVGVDPGTGIYPGRYLLVVDAIINPGVPLQWEVNVDASGTIAFGQSLSLDQGSTTSPRELIGGIWEAPIYGVSEELTIDPPPLLIMGEANPITGSEILTDFTLLGSGFDDFYCGWVSGTVTKPIMVDLEGSTWSMTLLKDAPYPVEFALGC